MQPFRQGDVILLPVEQTEGHKLSHLTLAEGEVTGHKHRITEGQAQLYDENGTFYLRVFSETALLTHEEHNAIAIPQGNWMVRISLDNQNRFHAIGEPAIQFADGYNLYSYQGITLSEKYGSLYPQQWQGQWVIEEKMPN